jgi:hypothetical protein
VIRKVLSWFFDVTRFTMAEAILLTAMGIELSTGQYRRAAFTFCTLVVLGVIRGIYQKRLQQ